MSYWEIWKPAWVCAGGLLMQAAVVGANIAFGPMWGIVITSVALGWIACSLYEIVKLCRETARMQF